MEAAPRRTGAARRLVAVRAHGQHELLVGQPLIRGVGIEVELQRHARDGERVEGCAPLGQPARASQTEVARARDATRVLLRRRCQRGANHTREAGMRKSGARRDSARDDDVIHTRGEE